MSRIGFNITPQHRGMCFCNEFLLPVKTWKEVAERHESYTLMRRHFSYLTDDGEDWVLDLFRCRDCGRYWAREDCGYSGTTRSFAFFYFLGTEDPERLLADAMSRVVLSTLDRKDDDFKTYIAPHLVL